MKYFVLVFSLAVATTVLAHPSGHKFSGGPSGGSGGSASVSQDNDNLNIGIPQAPGRVPLETAIAICKADGYPDHESHFCRLALEDAEIAFFCRRIKGIKGLGLRDLPFIGGYCR